MNKYLCLLLLLCFVVTSQKLIAQKPLHLSSPDGYIVFNFGLRDNAPFYDVSYKGTALIAGSGLGLSFQDGVSFEKSIKTGKPVFRDSVEDYSLVVGKTSHVHDSFREVLIPLQQTVAPFRTMNLVVRAFNDGLAFRYELPKQKDWTSFSLTSEGTAFRLAADPLVHTLFLANFTTSHEGQYSSLPFSQIREDTLMDMPTLMEFPGRIYLAITEAALLDYAGMSLEKHQGVLRGVLSPLPFQPSVKVQATLPHHSPWRVLMISDRIGALIESNLLTDLNAPPAFKDLSWIKPGKTSFPWWNGDVVPDTINAPGNNFVTNKYYIDFCARNHIEYHSVVEYGLHEWYVNDGANFMPGPHADPTRAVPGLDMKEICDYGKSVGVAIRVWVHWAALYPKLDSAFAQFEKWGLSGMMVDFMDRDDQVMVNIQTEILQKAAAHHLHIQFHGAYKPTGLSRTYPNEYTREGTLNYENNKWSRTITPDHDIQFPFTRMLAGSTDYHLGGFRAVPDSAFVIQYTRPLMFGTRCHMLAMYVVLENYLGMVCDYPSAYEGQPGFEFLQQVPTVWDQTRVIDAQVNQFITIARRKNSDWYVGSITNHLARTVHIPLSFLGPGSYTAEIYTDAQDVDRFPNHLSKQTRTVTSSENLDLPLAAGGGQVIRIIKQ